MAGKPLPGHRTSQLRSGDSYAGGMNRLRHATSPYLLQHADIPVDHEVDRVTVVGGNLRNRRSAA